MANYFFILILYILKGRGYQAADMDYIQSCDVFPEFCMLLFLDKAIKVLHSIPDEHRIGFMDSTGNLTRISLQSQKQKIVDSLHGNAY